MLKSNLRHGLIIINILNKTLNVFIKTNYYYDTER